MAEVAERKHECSATEQVTSPATTSCASARLLAQVEPEDQYSCFPQALADAHNEMERLQHEVQADNRAIDELGYQTVKCKAVCTSTPAVIAEETQRRRSLQQHAMDA